MTALELMEDTKVKAVNSLNRGNLFSQLLIILLIIFLVWGLWEVYKGNRAPHIDSITLMHASLISPAELCPGEILTMRYHLLVEGEGPLIRDTSVQHGDDIIRYSDVERFPVLGPIDTYVSLSWPIPNVFYDFRTGNMSEMSSGDYLYNVSVTSMERTPDFSMITFPFKIKKASECHGR